MPYYDFGQLLIQDRPIDPNLIASIEEEEERDERKKRKTAQEEEDGH